MDIKTVVKQEIRPLSSSNPTQSGLVAGRHATATATPPAVISLDSDSSSSSGSDSDEPSSNGDVSKRRKLDNLGVVLPVGFLSPLPQPRAQTTAATAAPTDAAAPGNSNAAGMGPQRCRQFWKAGDFDGAPSGNSVSDSGSVNRMDHVRVHPKFLHSNATSHKWALGAFAELLDNALDEYPNGATYVNIDMVRSRKDGSKMLLIEDNGGGMDPERMRQCMSLGYSEKSKEANTIGQYGNGFKTSTMRLGADVIVFSRSPGKDGKRFDRCRSIPNSIVWDGGYFGLWDTRVNPTQSIGLLSYTFLRTTRKEDIIVPMLDYEYVGEEQEWNRIIRFSNDDFNRNVETITQWSPFASETDLLRQFNMMSNHGTRVIIYNLWEDDQGLLELDFDSDPHDIQLRGVNREEKHIEMAKQYPNSKHFLTYRHSLRSYAAILYLRLPAGFRIILRGLDVEHHNIVNDMMLSEKVTYRPQGADGVAKDDMAVAVTVGFVKDAKHHIDLQGFNVYHKNRLIKPFWRLWNSASSQGRGVIGVLEANFVEPAHDKQGFERTTVLSRLETRLVQMQKNYWSKNCHHIGYASARNKKHPDDSLDRETSPGYLPSASSPALGKYNASSDKVSASYSRQQQRNGDVAGKVNNRAKSPFELGERAVSLDSSSEEDISDVDMYTGKKTRARRSKQKSSASKKFSGKNGLLQDHMSEEENMREPTSSQSKGYNLDKNDLVPSQSDSSTIIQLKQENSMLKERLEKLEEESQRQLSLQCENCKSLEIRLEEAQQREEELRKGQDGLLHLVAEEKTRRDKEEDKLRKKLQFLDIESPMSGCSLQNASATIQELLDKVKLLEEMKSRNFKA
ncbi:hypothetical protein Tsubulata_000599 [Turnera subulata]|uniref:Morc S5 domain-containing protein n=1 Tax=Turnera subulata TaxID=218843 RepID=A0A9Q0JP81_9ROSI|nr:hypothetical protein Tsubulata_000599 [Turnera subulata]